MAIQLARKVQIATLIADETPITILAEYLNFADIFSKKSATILLEYIKVNTHTIDLEKS